jgi:hypothetical protein
MARTSSFTSSNSASSSVDGWQTLATKLTDAVIDLAA